MFHKVEGILRELLFNDLCGHKIHIISELIFIGIYIYGWIYQCIHICTYLLIEVITDFLGTI